jgi:hypothetical protein
MSLQCSFLTGFIHPPNKQTNKQGPRSHCHFNTLMNKQKQKTNGVAHTLDNLPTTISLQNIAVSSSSHPCCTTLGCTNKQSLKIKWSSSYPQGPGAGIRATSRGVVLSSQNGVAHTLLPMGVQPQSNSWLGPNGVAHTLSPRGVQPQPNTKTE